MKVIAVESFLVPPEWLFVRIGTDEGVNGWGEAGLPFRRTAVAAAIDELAEFLVGESPLKIEDHWQVLSKVGFFRAARSSRVRSPHSTAPYGTSPAGTMTYRSTTCSAAPSATGSRPSRGSLLQTGSRSATTLLPPRRLNGVTQDSARSRSPPRRPWPEEAAPSERCSIVSRRSERSSAKSRTSRSIVAGTSPLHRPGCFCPGSSRIG